MNLLGSVGTSGNYSVMLDMDMDLIGQLNRVTRATLTLILASHWLLWGLEFGMTEPELGFDHH